MENKDGFTIPNPEDWYGNCELTNCSTTAEASVNYVRTLPIESQKAIFNMLVRKFGYAAIENVLDQDASLDTDF